LRFAIFELAMVSRAGGQGRVRAAQRVDGFIDQVGGLRVVVLQFPQPGGDLVGLVDVPLIHVTDYSKSYSSARRAGMRNAIDQMFFLPGYPFWSLTIIAADIVAIWGLCTYGSRENIEAAA
jgi:hypothetical protein